MTTSRFFAGRRADENGGRERPATSSSALASLRLRKRRRRAAARAGESEEARALPPLTEMEQQVVALRQAHPDKLLLFECGYRMRIFADDAERAAAVLGIRATRYKSLLEAAVPAHRALWHSRRLARAGFKVGIVRPIDSSAARAASQSPADQRRLLQRGVADVYTRATIPADDEAAADDAGHDIDVGVGAARFIMCIVEATVHSTQLFVQLVHVMDPAAKQLHGATEAVSIGVLAHDVHTGETSVAQFEDDARRLKLRRVLDSIEPIEFVLPRGGLSSYSERIIEDFARGQEARDGSTLVGGHEQYPTNVIRIERLDDAAFGAGGAAATRAQAPAVPWLSKLQLLSMRCLCAVRSYLATLSLENTLVSPRCTDVGHVAESSSASFCLPPETQRDLDLFINSTTRTYDGSLFSVMNQTKTEYGARRLREWIQNPLVSLSALRERQDAVRFLTGARGSVCELQTVDAHEELLAFLPRAKSLLRSLQRIHVGKAPPSVVVNALHVLVDVEEQVVALAAPLRAATSSAPLGSFAQARLVQTLLDAYPLVGDRALRCLELMDAGPAAKANDVEATVKRWLYRDEHSRQRFEALNAELAEIQARYTAELQSCQRALQDPTIAFKTHRGGSVRDIHHLIEVSRTRLASVPSSWLAVNSTKKLVRFHTREIVRLHVVEDFARQRKAQLVRAAWSALVSRVDGELYASAMGCIDVLATLDALCSLATAGKQALNCCMPRIEQSPDGGSSGSRVLEIEDARHPVLEALTVKSAYMGNSVSLRSVDKRGAMLGISGPNMGGKTSLLRTCALLVIMAQAGAFVPASAARLSLFDGVLTIIQRQLRPDTSRHSVAAAAAASLRAREVSAVSAVARAATSRSLVVVDELGVGLASHHSRALAVALARFVVDHAGSLLLFASHAADAMEALAARLGGAKCALKQLTYSTCDNGGRGGDGSGDGGGDGGDDEHVAFHYSVTDGVARDSLALDTARRAGVPRHIIQRAKDIIAKGGADQLASRHGER